MTNNKNEEKRIESKLEVQAYLDKLKYAIVNGSVKLNLQKDRHVDKTRHKRYTNRYTLGKLFPDEDEVEVLKRELSLLTHENYIETVKDTRFPNKSELRVFGKQYFGDNVYIKFRVELIDLTYASGGSTIVVISFHFSEWSFNESDFLIETFEVKRMRMVKSEKKLCLICMEEHKVQTVILIDTEEFKGEEVSFEATYEYCDHAEEYLETEDMIKANSLAMKDVYREKVGLLTSSEIIAIRNKYGVSQKDFSVILNWGKATITRYENHQVQDRAHDDVLRKIDSDPEWFLQMLKRAKGAISNKAFHKYFQTASQEFKKTQNNYLMDSIKAIYANYSDTLITGGVNLNLNKVVEIINYYAIKVSSLHKVKLMKMLWYADNLSYKQRGKSITGLVYCALKMGAVPEGYEQIVNLEGVSFETVLYDPDQIGYKFNPSENFKIKELTTEDIDILDSVISKVGHLNSREIIDKMHDEEAYKYSGNNSLIPFSYSEKLSI